MKQLTKRTNGRGSKEYGLTAVQALLASPVRQYPEQEVYALDETMQVCADLPFDEFVGLRDLLGEDYKPHHLLHMDEVGQLVHFRRRLIANRPTLNGGITPHNSKRKPSDNPSTASAASQPDASQPHGRAAELSREAGRGE